MAGIQDYSTTANNNISLMPEGINPAVLNNRYRDGQVDLRNWYNDAQWQEIGDGDGAGDGVTANYTIAYVNATQFTISGDVTAYYTPFRMIRMTVDGGSPIYGQITASSYSNPSTTVTVAWVSTTLTSGTLRAWLGIDGGVAAQAAISGRTLDGQKTSPQLLGPTETTQAVAISSNTVTFTPNDGQVITISLNANITTWAVTWPSGASSFFVRLTQDGTGGRTVAYPGAWTWPNGAEHVMTSTADAVDRIAVGTEDGGSTVFANIVGQAYA